MKKVSPWEKEQKDKRRINIQHGRGKEYEKGEKWIGQQSKDMERSQYTNDSPLKNEN